MSLVSSVKSAVKSTVNKVGSTVGNLAGQASALAKSISKPAVSSTVGSQRSVVPTRSTVPVSSGVSYSNGVPVKSTVSPGSTIVNSKPASQPVSTTGHGVVYSNGVPVGSSVSPGSSMTPVSRSSGGNSKGGSNMLSSAYSALQSALGGGNSGINPEDSYASYDYGSPDSYKGTPGNSSTTYSRGQSSSLEQQAQDRSNMEAGNETSQTKANASKILNDVDAARKTSLTDLEAQLAAKQNELKAIQDATTVTDDLYDPDKDENIRKINEQLRALERSYESAQKETPEETAAKQQLDQIAADEAAVNAGLTEKVTEVNKEAIPQGFLTGWGTTFNKDANAKLTTLAANKIPLTQRLATAQAKRQAAMDVVKTRISDAKDSRSRATDAYSTNYNRKNKKADDAQSRADSLAKDRYKTIGDGTQLYDTATGKVVAENSKSYAPKSTSSGTTLSKATIAAGEAKLKASRGGDGYVDPTVYQTAFNEWPGTTAEFLSKFPPKAYVNPANTWLPAVLRPSSGTSRSI